MEATRGALPIVVGVDGSPGAKAALRFALAEGLIRGASVHVVTTWLLGSPLRETITDTVFDEQTASTRELQNSVLAEVSAGFADLPEVVQLVVHDVGGATLIDAARGSSMLVVGSGRKGPLARAFLGSVSEFCVRHATVPVVVVPDPARVDQALVGATQTSTVPIPSRC